MKEPAIAAAGLSLGGISIGGIETCIDVPEWKLAFDLGRCPDSAVSRATVLFTHAHIDHMGGVAWHAATRALRGMRPPTYVVPRENVEGFTALFEAWRQLDRSELEHHIVPLAPGEELLLPNKLIARPFRSIHRVPCQGYGIWRRHQRLLPELAGLPANEIRRLRVDEAREVTETVETPEFAFTGDTRIEVLEREAVVRKARRLVLECTFVDDKISVDEARSKGHVHLDEIAERAHLFENEVVVLSHFSARHRPREILRALDERLPAELRRRVVPLLC